MYSGDSGFRVRRRVHRMVDISVQLFLLVTRICVEFQFLVSFLVISLFVYTAKVHRTARIISQEIRLAVYFDELF